LLWHMSDTIPSAIKPSPSGTKLAFLTTAQCAVVQVEMSKHIRPVFAVPKLAVALTANETGGTAIKAVTDEVASLCRVIPSGA
jgi:hypothetical protein